jgi:hypothetical protein
MDGIFYQIFNKKVKITAEKIELLRLEALQVYEKFKEKQDIDFVKILKNKLEHLLEKRKKKESKDIKKAYIKIEDFLDEINCYLEENTKEEIELVDVVKKIDKKYKKYDDIKEEKRHLYKRTSRKIKTIEYEKELIKLQLELLKLQKHIKENQEKLLIIFEGRDAA